MVGWIDAYTTLGCVRVSETLINLCPWGPGTVERQCVQRIAKVHDQHLSFIALEAGLFSLGLPNTYLAINDPGANDSQIEVRPHILSPIPILPPVQSSIPTSGWL